MSFAKALHHRYDGLLDLEQFSSNRSEETLVLRIRRAVVRLDLLLLRRRLLLLLPSQSLAPLRLNLEFCLRIHSGGRTDGYSWTCRWQLQIEQRRRRQQVDGKNFCQKVLLFHRGSTSTTLAVASPIFSPSTGRRQQVAVATPIVCPSREPQEEEEELLLAVFCE
jgi:hypothetical protein